MKSERGNIIVYVLVGLVLFGALAGSVWWVNNRAQTETQAPVATESAPAEDGTTETSVDQDAVSAPQPDSAASSDDQPVANNPEQPAPTPASPQTPTLAPESQTPSNPTPAQVANAGPVENSLMTASGLGVIAYLSSLYVRSRRSL